MKNSFGQDIRVGSFVGLGIRSGNTSEQRVGIVLDLFSKPSWGDKVDWYGKCAWHAEDNPIWDAASMTYVPRPVMISNQRFRFFLLDKDSLDEEVVRVLCDAYAEHMTRTVSTFIPEK